MPSVKENLESWNKEYHWSNQGDEWSVSWGDPITQWHGTLYPRLRSFIPADTILEIAPGYGRWTQFLAQNCKKLIIVDLSEECIQYCKNRFAGLSHIEYHVNDGKSLEMVADNSIDFIFSFDSLVHAEMDTLETYVHEFSKKLSKEGVGFVHHSNLGNFSQQLTSNSIPGSRWKHRIGEIFGKSVDLKMTLNDHWRARSVTQESVLKACQVNNLHCIVQELINWGNDPEYLIDCLSLFCRTDGKWAQKTEIYENRDFMKEAEYLRKIYDHYTSKPQLS